MRRASRKNRRPRVCVCPEAGGDPLVFFPIRSFVANSGITLTCSTPIAPFVSGDTSGWNVDGWSSGFVCVDVSCADGIHVVVTADAPNINVEMSMFVPPGHAELEPLNGKGYVSTDYPFRGE